MRRQTWMLPGAAVVALGALGCATQGPKPTEEMTRARAVIEQADKGNAQRYAAADLQKAHDELRDAERANDARRYDEAHQFAESAEVDADVATARGNAGEAQRAAHEIQKGTDTLQNESDRKTGDSGVAPNAVTAPLQSTPPPNTTATPDAAVPR
jgi:hypothetical protein